MPAGGSQRQRAFRGLLTADIREINRRSKWWRTLRGRPLARNVVQLVEKANSLFKRVDAIHLDSLDNSRFRCIHRWDNNSAQLRLARKCCEAGGATDGSYQSVERQLARNGELRQSLIGILAHDALKPEHRERDRKVVDRTFFTKIRRREVDGAEAARKRQ